MSKVMYTWGLNIKINRHKIKQKKSKITTLFSSLELCKIVSRDSIEIQKVLQGTKLKITNS